MINQIKMYWISIFPAYWQQKWRVLFMILMFAVGVGALFSFFALRRTVQSEIIKRFQAEGVNLFTVIKRCNADFCGRNQMRPLDLEVADRLSKNKNMELFVAPENRINMPVAYKTARFEAPILGVTESYRVVNELNVAQGRFLAYPDGGEHVCVVGNRVWEKLTEINLEKNPGAVLHIGPLAFRIIGVLHPYKGFQSEGNLDESVLVPFQTLARYQNDGQVSKISIRTTRPFSIKDIKNFIQLRLTMLLGDASAYEVTNQQVFIEKIRRQVNEISFYLGLVGVMFTLVGLFLLISVVSSRMKNRRKFNALINIFGANPQKIQIQFFIEIFLLGILTASLGVAIGRFFIQKLADALNWFAIIPVESFIFGYLFSFCLILIIGLFLIRPNRFYQPGMTLQME